MNTIYIGASNRKLGLSQFTIYKEKPTELIEMLKPKMPSVERLFVLVENFAEVEKDLSKPETLIYKAWAESKGAK